MDRWRAWLLGYLVWVILFAVVEGAGRQVCRVPTAKWMAEAADARDRTARVWFRDRAEECLGHTRWYSYSTAALSAIGLAAPFSVVWFVRRRAAGDPALTSLPTLATHFGLFIVSLAITVGTMAGVRWLYDWAA